MQREGNRRVVRTVDSDFRAGDSVGKPPPATVLTTRVVWVSTERLRLLILIVAYNAESTLAPVLDRLPPAVLSDYDCEVLVIDDASDGCTFEHGLSYRH